MTVVTLADHLAAALLPWRVDQALSPAARQTLAGLAGRLPARLSGFFGLECRLGEAAPVADILFRVDAPDERAALAELDPAPGDPVWRRLRAFAAAWPGPAERLWLEFDTAAGPTLLPSVFFGARRMGDWVFDALAGIRGEALPPATIACFGRCRDALPEGGEIFQIGTMLSRPEAFLRLCVRGVAHEAVRPWLASVGWDGADDAVAAFLDGELARMGTIRLGLDVTDRVAPRLGFECAVPPERLAAFVALLEAEGLCLPGKGRGLLAWPGLVHARLGRGWWPADLAAQAGDGVSSAMLRTIHHIKIAVGADGRREAKGYLAIRPVLVRDADLARALRGET